jgi:hypothetical protein
MKFRSTLIAIAMAAACLAVHAQETRATLTGTVSDVVGARVPGAQIAITNTDTGVVTHAKSNGTGDYTVPFLQPGHYSVTVTMAGFATYTHTNMELQTEQVLKENITLKNGDVSETVTVAAGAPLIDTADAATGRPSPPSRSKSSPPTAALPSALPIWSTV